LRKESMARISKKFAERVSDYATDGLTVRSAEGTGISRSKKSLDEGVALAKKGLRRRRRQLAQS
jgi:hypothetical protein